MNSKVIRSNWESFTKGLPEEQGGALAQKCLVFQAALRSDPKNLKAQYQDLLDTIRKCEKISGVQIVESPDGNFFAALSELSGVFAREAEKQLEAAKPREGSVTLASVEEADDWLSSHPTVVPGRLEVGTRSTPGLFANHSQATEIRIEYMDYKKETGYLYGMCEDEITKLFTRADKSSLLEKWRARNPGLEPVLISIATNARGSASSLTFGFGSDRVEHNTLYIIYREPAGESRGSGTGSGRGKPGKDVPAGYTVPPTRPEPEKRSRTAPVKEKKHTVLHVVLFLLLFAVFGSILYNIAYPGFFRDIGSRLRPAVSAEKDAKPEKVSGAVSPSAAEEGKPAERAGTASAAYAGITFTAERKSASRGVLTVTSAAKETWKFAPWVGHETTVTLVRVDGTRADAVISTDQMFWTYHTSHFDAGKTFRFDLAFDGTSDADWDRMMISICSFGDNQTVTIPFR